MLGVIEGIQVGHWTDHVARTGCTVVLLPEGAVASGEVRGGAPATREFALLEPTRTVSTVDAIVLSGGSVFGLAASDGVARALEARGRGVVTPHGRVPIVVAMSLFDLGVGDASVRPGPDEGISALDAVCSDPALGRVGAGAGATIGTWLGADRARPGGLGGAVAVVGSVTVAALVAVNAVGGSPRDAVADDPGAEGPADLLANTTIGVVATDAALTKLECHLLAQAAHDGLARAIVPAHTGYDGDAFVVAATGAAEGSVSFEMLRHLAARTVSEAIAAVTGDPAA